MKKTINKIHFKPVVFLLLLTTLAMLFIVTFTHDRQSVNEDIVKAEIVGVGELVDDQGLLFQKFKVNVEDGSEIDLEINANQLKGKNFEVGTGIYLQKQTFGGQLVYEFVSYQKLDTLIFLFIILGIFCLLTLGLTGIKYIFPAFVVLIFFIFGYNIIFFQAQWGYFFLLLLVFLISLLSMIIVFKSYRLAFLISSVNIMMVLFVILLALLALELLGLLDLYFQFSFFRVNLNVQEFAKLFITAIATIAYGFIIHANFALIEKVDEIKNKKKKIKRNDLINRSIEASQKVSGQQISVISFIIIGFASLWIFIDANAAILNLVENLFIYKFLLILIILVVTVVINGYIVALTTALYYDSYFGKKPGK